LSFSQTPSDKFLNITNVSCNVVTSSPQILAAATLEGGTTFGANDLARTYAIMGNATPQTSAGSTYYSIVQNGVFYKFGPGRFPSIFFLTSTAGSAEFDCVIVGNLTDD
jgi:hypothetical protein